MLNRAKHQLIMGQILKDIYTDVSISSLLGFKGGTCAYFFYNLPRFSVDLDFDLLVTDQDKQKLVLEKIVAILSKYGQIKDQYIKRFTIFALLSYGDDDHNVKIEINVRQLIKNISSHYELKDYLGISMLVAKADYLFASKLAALTSRQVSAARDIYDIYYFAKNNWDINIAVLKERTGQELKDYLTVCLNLIENFKDSHIMQGLGELVNNDKEKMWIKNHLKSEVLFLLKNYISVIN
jgi:predicted nucleotidyltransferase component of viral defense system